MPDMAKRHFELIAAALQVAYPVETSDHPQLRQVPHELRLEQWELTVTVFADRLSATYGIFKRDRFIRACQPGANVRARS